MNKILITIFSIVVLVSCGYTNNDRLVYNEFSILLQNSLAWKNYLEKQTDGKYDQTEVRRVFFKYNITTPQMYQQFVFFKNYFQIPDKDINLIHIRRTLEEKDILYSTFYDCQDNLEIDIKELLKTEEVFYFDLVHIDSLIIANK